MVVNLIKKKAETLKLNPKAIKHLIYLVFFSQAFLLRPRLGSKSNLQSHFAQTNDATSACLSKQENIKRKTAAVAPLGNGVGRRVRKANPSDRGTRPTIPPSPKQLSKGTPTHLASDLNQANSCYL